MTLAYHDAATGAYLGGHVDVTGVGEESAERIAAGMRERAPVGAVVVDVNVEDERTEDHG